MLNGVLKHSYWIFNFIYVFIVGLILAILMIGVVNKTDTISEDVVSNEDDTPLEITDNNVYMAGENSFSNLEDEIKKYW